MYSKTMLIDTILRAFESTTKKTGRLPKRESSKEVQHRRKQLAEQKRLRKAEKRINQTLREGERKRTLEN